MSIHSLPAKTWDFDVVVGWMNPLSTFFAVVERRIGDDVTIRSCCGLAAHLENIREPKTWRCH
jgi:hypothetical protein